MGADDAVVFEGHRACRARDLDAAWVAGIGCGRGVKNTERAAGKLKRGDGGVFGFDFVKQSGSSCLHANDVTEQPEQEIDSVDALIDYSAAAVEGLRAAPA